MLFLVPRGANALTRSEFDAESDDPEIDLFAATRECRTKPEAVGFPVRENHRPRSLPSARRRLGGGFGGAFHRFRATSVSILRGRPDPVGSLSRVIRAAVTWPYGAIVFHKLTASSRTWSRKCLLRPRSVTMSTLHPRQPCRSINRPPRSNVDRPGSRSIRKSTSLVASASLRATDPKGIRDLPEAVRRPLRAYAENYRAVGRDTYRL